LTVVTDGATMRDTIRGGAVRTKRSRPAKPPRGDDAARVSEIARRLLAAYGPVDFPRAPPLDELVATILSQSTTDANSERAYRALRDRFATWDEVRRAPRAAVERAIRSAGLFRQKARVIQEALDAILAERGRLDLDHLSAMADDDALRDLARLRGVGLKTAACVLCFSLGRPTMPVDTHVHRLARRLALAPADATPEETHRVLNRFVPPEIRLDLHVGLVRHGRAVCVAARPFCSRCVLADLCPKIGVPPGLRR
jgi:endonuclease-3